MIQLVVNTNLLREIDERKLINAYARFMYNDKKDTTDDIQIKENLKQLLDWDENGDSGLGVYCGKFESLKSKDLELLVRFIKENQIEIQEMSQIPSEKRRLESIKIINDTLESKKQYNIARFTDENYEVSGRGKKAKSCVYNGKTYKSRQECIYKEQISQNKLYKYLKETNQI